MTAGAFRFRGPSQVMWRLPDSLREGLNRAGLRYWRLTAFASIHNERIESVSVTLYSVGRYEALGSNWGFSNRIPPQYARWATSPEQQRTYMGWYHITSVPSGEGFHVYATPGSTQKELRARRINRRCLFSFRGCDGLCELLPDAVPVLKERNSSSGGGTGAPPSRCELE
jgi:hypothetical protein